MPDSKRTLNLTNLPEGLKTLFINTSAGKMRIVTGGNGPLLIMIHGLGGSAEDYFHMAPFLLDRHTLVIIDLPGFGESDKPDKAYTAEWLVKILVEAASVLGVRRADWLGHSLGGGVVLRLGALHPELARSLTAVNPVGGHLTRGYTRSLLIFLCTRPGDRLWFWMPWMVRFAMYQSFSDPTIPAAKELSERIIRKWRGPERAVMEKVIIRLSRDLIANPVWPELHKICCPVFLVGCEKDFVIPVREIKNLFNHLPEGLGILKWLNCGHMPLYSRPKPLSRKVSRFILYTR